MKLPYLLSLCCLFMLTSLKAQRNILPLSVFPQQAAVLESQAYNLDLLTADFENDSLRINNVYPWRGASAFFITYQKLDTLSFQDPFFKEQYVSDYTREGLAFYVRQGDAYRLQFANPDAFMCTRCNNMTNHGISLVQDTLHMYMDWGPSVSYAHDAYTFVFSPTLKIWELKSVYTNSMDDADDVQMNYSVYPSHSHTSLADFAAEGFAYAENDLPAVEVISLQLQYSLGSVPSLEKALRSLPKDAYPYLAKVFFEDDMRRFLYTISEGTDPMDYIQAANVEKLNNIAFYLEQASALDPAQMLLEAILTRFPEREVANLSLGDVYLKKGDLQNAYVYYQRYIFQMHKRGLSAKIPTRVSDFIGKY